MTKYAHVVTGSCPKTLAESRLEMAEWKEADGDHEGAKEYRAIVARLRREWDERDTPAGVKRRLTSRVPLIDPDEREPVLGWGIWHTQAPDETVVCPCGHFATLLCDEPIGRGATCDKPLCACCTVALAGFDQCDFHAETDPRSEAAAAPPPIEHRGRLVLVRRDDRGLVG